MAQQGSKGHTKACQAIWHFPHLPLWMALGTCFTAEPCLGGPGLSRMPGQQVARAVVTELCGSAHNAKANNLMLIYPDFWHSWENTLVVLQPSFHGSSNHTPHWNAMPLKHPEVCFDSLENLGTLRNLSGLTTGTNKAHECERMIPSPKPPFPYA